MKRNQWRTVLVAGGGMFVLLLGLAAAGHWPSAAGVYMHFALGVAACVASVAAKATKEHQAIAAQPAAAAGGTP